MGVTTPYPLEPASTTLAALQKDGDTRVVIEPDPDELFLDFDGGEEGAFEECVRLLRANNESVEIVRDTPSRTPGHRHVVLRLHRELSVMERIALQACLGSDSRRELLAILRVWNRVHPVTVFFEEAHLSE